MSGNILPRPAPPPVDFAAAARRVIVATSALAGLVGILMGRPLLAVLERTALLALVGLAAIAIVALLARRAAPEDAR